MIDPQLACDGQHTNLLSHSCQLWSEPVYQRGVEIISVCGKPRPKRCGYCGAPGVQWLALRQQRSFCSVEGICAIEDGLFGMCVSDRYSGCC
jgi:hypothetical protein